MIHWALHASSHQAACARGDGLLTVAESARLGSLQVTKRRADWVLGRITAKAVVAAALADVSPGECPLWAIEIPSEPTGMPYARIAPESRPMAGFAPGERLPLRVSISHAEGHALCAAAWDEAGNGSSRRTLGIDLGFVEPRSPQFVATFFTEDEQRFVGDGPAPERDLRANLVWCAKEAVLKALGLGLTVDTLELSCVPEGGLADIEEWPLAPADGEWHSFVATCSRALLSGGGTIRGVWRTFPGFVGALASHSVTGAVRPAYRERGHVATRGAAGVMADG